jgi:hypothetical protein
MHFKKKLGVYGVSMKFLAKISNAHGLNHLSFYSHMLSCKKKYKTLLMELKNDNINQLDFLGMINTNFLILRKWKFHEMVLMLMR